MDKIQFNAEERDGKGKGVARKLRVSGFIPAVLYGPGYEPALLKVEKKSAEDIIRKLESHNVMAEIVIKKGKKKETVKTVLKDIHTHPIRGDILHLDFYRVRMDHTVRMGVAVHLTGEAPGIEKGGILEQEVRELQVQALPDRIPSIVEVDISKLDIGHSILVKDIVLPEGVTAVDDPEKVVVTVLAPKAEKVEVAEEGAEVPATETPAEPEVISEKEAAERRREKEAREREEKE
ncbi:MAG TPA: 50S ribosomal protein L25 [bacterium]|nr:50S ribosomal protein L25 [bacterium]HPP30242.1 50S ribosomal protein L25 [bacterium]